MNRSDILTKKGNIGNDHLPYIIHEPDSSNKQRSIDIYCPRCEHYHTFPIDNEQQSLVEYCPKYRVKLFATWSNSGVRFPLDVNVPCAPPEKCFDIKNEIISEVHKDT